MDIEIRPLHPDDLEYLHELWRLPAIGRTTLQIPSLELPQVIERVKEPNRYRHRLVADSNGRVIGIITLTHYQRPRMHHAGTIGMMVHPDYWHQGIGTQLMEAILNIADNWLNLKRVELEVNTDNPAAIRLYEKCGFVIEGTKKMHVYGDGRWADTHFMARLRD